MRYQAALWAVCFACGAAAMLGAAASAVADPQSPYFSQQMLEQNILSQETPWQRSKVDLSQYTSESLGAGLDSLGAIAPGQSGMMAGVNAGMGAMGEALGAPLNALGIGGGIQNSPVIGSGSGASGALSAGTGALGALGLGR